MLRSLPSPCERTVTVLSAFAVPTPSRLDRNVGRARGGGEHGNGIGRGRNTAAAALGYGRRRGRQGRNEEAATHNRETDAGNKEAGDSPLERHCTTSARAATPGGSQAPPSA